MYDAKKLDAISQWVGTGSINIFGRPFSGKDTQGLSLAKLLGGNLVGGGDILRKSAISKNVDEKIRSGKLAPTVDYINIVLPYLEKTQFHNKPLILSSLGRWHGEESAVVDALLQSNHPLKAVVYLDISSDESHKRWLARDVNNDRHNRHDDTEEVLNTRFQEFADKTLPVLEYYRNLGLLIEIDGKGSRDEITQNILDALYQKAAKK